MIAPNTQFENDAGNRLTVHDYNPDTELVTCVGEGDGFMFEMEPNELDEYLNDFGYTHKED